MCFVHFIAGLITSLKVFIPTSFVPACILHLHSNYLFWLEYSLFDGQQRMCLAFSHSQGEVIHIKLTLAIFLVDCITTVKITPSLDSISCISLQYLHKTVRIPFVDYSLKWPANILNSVFDIKLVLLTKWNKCWRGVLYYEKCLKFHIASNYRQKSSSSFWKKQKNL